MTQVVDPAAKDRRTVVQKLRDRLKVTRRDTPVDDDVGKTSNEPNPIYGRAGPFESTTRVCPKCHSTDILGGPRDQPHVKWRGSGQCGACGFKGSIVGGSFNPAPATPRTGPFENNRKDSPMAHAATIHERLAKRIAENTPMQDVSTPGMTDIAGHGLRTPKDYEIVPAAAAPQATAPAPGNVGLVKEIEDLAAHFGKRGMARTADALLAAVHQCKIEGGV